MYLYVFAWKIVILKSDKLLLHGKSIHYHVHFNIDYF